MVDHHRHHNHKHYDDDDDAENDNDDYQHHQPPRRGCESKLLVRSRTERKEQTLICDHVSYISHGFPSSPAHNAHENLVPGSALVDEVFPEYEEKSRKSDSL